MHNRVPFGVYKIGLVGEGKEKKFLTNDIAGDRRVPNPKWAAQLGFVAFAGYKLAVSEDKPLGVLALFANHPIPPEEDAMLENMASSIAAAVQTAQVQQAIRESEDKFRTLYEASSDAVFLLDKGQVIDCNAAAAGMFQAGRDGDLKAVLFSELAADAWGASLSPAEALQTAVSDGSVRFEAKLRRISGHTFPADLCLTAMDLGSRKVVQAVVRDITERKEAEAERERLIEDLKEALANIKTLRGLLPICASCKKVRDDRGYWNQIEVYLHAHSEAEFSHSVCPECMEKLYPDAYARMQARKEKENEPN